MPVLLLRTSGPQAKGHATIWDSLGAPAGTQRAITGIASLPERPCHTCNRIIKDLEECKHHAKEFDDNKLTAVLNTSIMCSTTKHKQRRVQPDTNGGLQPQKATVTRIGPMSYTAHTILHSISHTRHTKAVAPGAGGAACTVGGPLATLHWGQGPQWMPASNDNRGSQPNL